MNNNSLTNRSSQEILNSILNLWTLNESVQLAVIVHRNGPDWDTVSRLISENGKLNADDTKPESFYSATLCEKQYKSLLSKYNIEGGHDDRSNQLLNILENERKQELKNSIDPKIVKIMELFNLKEKLNDEKVRNDYMNQRLKTQKNKESEKIKIEALIETWNRQVLAEKTEIKSIPLAISDQSDSKIEIDQSVYSTSPELLDVQIVSEIEHENTTESVLATRKLQENVSEIFAASISADASNGICDNVINEIPELAEPIATAKKKQDDSVQSQSPDLKIIEIDDKLSSQLSAIDLDKSVDSSEKLLPKSKEKTVFVDITKRNENPANAETIKNFLPPPPPVSSKKLSPTLVSIGERAKTRMRGTIPQSTVTSNTKQKRTNMRLTTESKSQPLKRTDSESEFITIEELESTSTETSELTSINKTTSTSGSILSTTNQADVMQIDDEIEKENGAKLSNDTFKRTALEIWKSISQHRHAHHFKNPVPNSVMNYNEQILKKVDLSSIKKRIKNENISNGLMPITSMSEFKAAFLHMVVNAQMFNHMEDPIVNDGFQMFDEIDAYFDCDLNSANSSESQSSRCTRQSKRKQEQQKNRSSLNDTLSNCETNSSNNSIIIESKGRSSKKASKMEATPKTLASVHSQSVLTTSSSTIAKSMSVDTSVILSQENEDQTASNAMETDLLENTIVHSTKNLELLQLSDKESQEFTSPKTPKRGRPSKSRNMQSVSPVSTNISTTTPRRSRSSRPVISNSSDVPIPIKIKTEITDEIIQVHAADNEVRDGSARSSMTSKRRTGSRKITTLPDDSSAILQLKEVQSNTSEGQDKISPIIPRRGRGRPSSASKLTGAQASLQQPTTHQSSPSSSKINLEKKFGQANTFEPVKMNTFTRNTRNSLSASTEINTLQLKAFEQLELSKSGNLPKRSSKGPSGLFKGGKESLGKQTTNVSSKQSSFSKAEINRHKPDALKAISPETPMPNSTEKGKPRKSHILDKTTTTPSKDSASKQAYSRRITRRSTSQEEP